ncbi:RNA polymerase sigma factor [Sorangium sp. So ce1024]|uniref:RNA polymerase sigma factor n=1 Tax=Sorangium sp. So ce1024 TaxID=3133327 RepID=UPI003F0F6968
MSRAEREDLDEIMRRYALGEEDVFDRLYALLAPRLYRFCLRLTGCAPEADDLFQESFLRIHRARASYMAGSSVYPWAFAIARSLHLDRLRYRRRHPEEVAPTGDPVVHGPSSDHTSCPEAEVGAHELLRVVTLELSKMSELSRVAYLLLKEEGLNVSEAAAVLGTSTDVVKQRAHRAYNQIRAALCAAGWTEHCHEAP